ncbi:hypothetical protein AKJ64_00525 [candidate division MSBL1 archaeon SCGC-AAA259E17]|uniref:Mre11 DNA-binding domain-containing protein n=1 Tax=candidate division MSBL1 archaeon SCGC-AAA259E17 TaxID=1698263 RepID=A0A133UH54_9EURY|nr:hypothetical protein AKJ64_00525 [candidate division MSBL1 archaeon SCGC-AAA259E17]
MFSMKIAIVSDFHLGTKEGTLREDDSFIQAREAIERALELGAQLILIAGDIFDSRNPSQEVWARGMKILSLASEKENQGITLSDTVGKEKSDITALPLRGTPVVAIHGNHERRGRGFVDSIEALESAGLVIRLHHNTVVFETPDGRVAIHGMGYVPEDYAMDLLNEWNPEPVEGATNIFMIHQGLGRFTFSSSGAARLRPSDFVEGFELYVSGHVHYWVESEVHGKPLIFPGSTVRTQLLPVEAEKAKGFYLVNLQDGDIDYKFVELESVREFYYEEENFEGATSNQVENWIRTKLEELLNKSGPKLDKRPLARFRLTGTLSKGSSRGDIDVSRIEAEFEDKVLLSISREDLSSPELEEKTKLLRDIREEKISMEERGMKILDSNLEDLNYDQRFDSRTLYELLSEDRVDEAFEKVSEKLKELVESNLEEKND